MSDDTAQITQSTTTSTAGESKLGSFSVRAWICSLIIGTICARELIITVWLLMVNSTPTPLDEPLRSLALVCVGYFFQKMEAARTIQTTTSTPPSVT